MKKYLFAIVALVAATFFTSCDKNNNGGKKEDSRPVCTRLVFSISSKGYSKEFLDLFTVTISGVDFNGVPFSSNGTAEYEVVFEKAVHIDSSDDHNPISVKVSVEKKEGATLDPAKSYSFPHTFYIQAEYYDAEGNKLNVSGGELASEKIDRVKYSHDEGTETYSGDRFESKVRRTLEMDYTYVFFRHSTQDFFCCTTK